MDSVSPSDPIRCVASFEPETIARRATVVEAATQMQQASCSALLVDQNDGSPGVITERDIVWALAEHGPDAGDWVTDLMTRDVVTVSAETSIIDAAQVMIDGGIRHLIIEDDEHDRRGIVRQSVAEPHRGRVPSLR